jgi:biotin carboxyl carrier protein
MKMENEIRSPRNGVVERLDVAPGQRVSHGDVLLRIGPPQKA